VWEVVDMDTKTEDTNDAVPIIHIYKTSTTWNHLNPWTLLTLL
jgi:hypothetical protein